MAFTSHIINVAKNTAYRYHFQSWSLASSPIPELGAINISPAKLKISKDDGSYVNTTNNFVEVGNGLYYVDLTSTEMNADVISLYFGSGSGSGDHAMIYTGLVGSGGSGGGISLDDEIEGKVTLPTGNLTIRQIFELLLQRLGRNNPKI